METTSIINLLPSNKQQVQTFAASVVAKVQAGEVNPLDLKCQMKFIEKTLAEIDKQIKDSFLKEASKHGKLFEYKGWEISEGEFGTTYDYSNDAEWNELKQKLKDRETFLKSLKEPLTIVNKETGEITIAVPPIKKSTTSLKFSLK